MTGPSASDTESLTEHLGSARGGSSRPGITLIGRPILGFGPMCEGPVLWRSAGALAECLGTPLLDFPGGRSGFAGDAMDVATVLPPPGVARGIAAYGIRLMGVEGANR